MENRLNYGRRGISSFVKAAMLGFILIGAVAVFGQTDSGRITGNVTDSAGAVVPNAAVTVTNIATGISRKVMTNEEGFYTVTNLPVGNYNVVVEMTNFKKSISPANSLSADGRLTVDFKIETGQISETVEVTPTSGETVNNTSGEVAKVIDNQQINNLALNGRNYYQLLSIIPGAVVTADDALDTNLATNTININGNRGVSNNLTVDGGNNNNAGSNASQINNVGVDFIQEVKLQTSNFSAEYGRNSGAQINVITKRGGNKYHGSMFEFLRNDRFDAKSAFDAVKPLLRYHNYGYSFGGPLPYPNFGDSGGPWVKSGKDKLFFFFGEEWKSIHRFAATSTQSLPTTAELNGDFSLRLRGADGIVGTADDGALRDPLVAGTCTTAVRTACFAGNKIPTNRLTPDGIAIANVYRRMISLAAGYIDSPIGSNGTFQPPLKSDFRQELLRIDWVANSRHTIFGRYIHDKNIVVDPFGTFINSALPTAHELRNRPGVALQLGHLFNISPSLINDFRFNTSGSNQRVVPDTDNAERASYGFAFTQLFPSGGQYESSIPNTTISGAGALAGYSGVAATLTALTHDYLFTDNVTWVKSNHTLKFGGLFNYNQTFQNGRSNYAGSVTFNGVANSTFSTGQAFGDALLGNFSSYSEASSDPSSHFRFKQYEAYALDSWRVNKRLSVELGVRWQFGVPFYTAENTVANFDPSTYDPSKAVTLSTNGNVVTVPAGANRFNGLVRAGQIADKDIPLIGTSVLASVLAAPVASERGFWKPKNYFMPRVSFAYSPFDDQKTSIRGGFGMYYDRIEGNVIFPLENNPPFVDSATFNNGNLSNIRGGAAAALAPFAALTTIDPNMVPSSSMNFSLGVQRELPWGLFVEATGIGNLGRHLTRQQDINAVSFAAQVANSLAPTVLGINALRPYKGYTNINERSSDATSHYYAMQLYAAKRRGDLLFTTSYTYGKVLTDANVLTEAAENGPFDRHFNYGPATFDRRHIFVATYTYAMPFFKGTHGLVKSLLYGYEVSGITRLQAGKPYTVTASSNIGNQGSTRRADLISGVPLYLDDPNNDRIYLNPAAFAAPPTSRLGTSGVGIITGPILATTDFSVRKRFRFSETKDLRLQGDVFNAFNRNNYSNIATVVTTTSTYGRFTSAGPGRSIQLGIKFGF